MARGDSLPPFHRARHSSSTSRWCRSLPAAAHLPMAAIRIPLAKWPAIGCAVACGLLYFLAFAGVDIWPLAFIAFVPLFVAIEGQTPKRSFWLGVLAGGTMNLAGFYWLIGMLQTFSGFPFVACLFFAAVVCGYQ